MELLQLNTFCTVANTRSFTQTSELLGYAQSSISAQVRSLEEELGVKLFDRLGKGVYLTPAGERLLVYAEKMLALAQDAKNAVICCNVPRGKLVIGAPESISIYRLPRVLKEYRIRYPQVEIVLKLGSCAELLNWLSKNIIDMTILLDDHTAINEFVVESLGPEKLTLVAGPEHRLSSKKSVLPLDLQGEQLILIEKDACYRTMFEEQLAREQVEPGAVIEIGSIETVKKCLASGLGVSLLPRMSVEQELATGVLSELPWTGSDVKLSALLIHHKDKWISPAIGSFMILAKELLQDARCS